MMMFLNTIRLAVRSILSNKMRSFLTMLGIIIGVVSVVVLMSIAQGTTSSISSSISSMGSDLITISITDEDYAVTEEDLMALAEESYIDAVSPYISSQGVARSGRSYISGSMIGATENYMEIQNLSLQSGRGIVPSDLEYSTSVAVIGIEIAGKLFKSYDVIGKTFTMSNREFTIIGLLEESGTTSVGSRDNLIIIPLTKAQRVTDTNGLTTCYARATSDSDVDAAKNTAELFMYGLTGDEDVYTVYTSSDLLDTLDDVMSTMSLLLGGIAAISLLVGGIGIMNIMLVSVAERTREIGIRKAIGARRLHIMSQFLTEACVLSILGGLIGLGFSELGIKVYSIISDTAIFLEWRAAAGALVFCVIIGVIFGGYPANKASKMTPIDALQRR